MKLKNVCHWGWFGKWCYFIWKRAPKVGRSAASSEFDSILRQAEVAWRKKNKSKPLMTPDCSGKFDAFAIRMMDKYLKLH